MKTITNNLSHKKTRHLKDDKVFRDFFKNNQKPLISLLQSFLPFPKPRSIKEVKILDSLLPSTGNLSGKKESIMDLRLELDNNEIVNVEMQLYEHPSFIERMIFYGCKNYFSQLNKGEKYKQLHPSYSLVFCDFELFKRDKEDRRKFYRSCTLREDDLPHHPVSHHLRVVFVELPKVKQKIEDLVDFKQAWCYLFNHIHEMGDREKELFASKNKQMEELMDWTRPLTLKESEQVIAEAEEKQRRDRIAREDYVFDQGLEEGMEKVALNMLNEKVDPHLIGKVTGLSLEKLKKLKK